MDWWTHIWEHPICVKEQVSLSSGLGDDRTSHVRDFDRNCGREVLDDGVVRDDDNSLFLKFLCEIFKENREKEEKTWFFYLHSYNAADHSIWKRLLDVLRYFRIFGSFPHYYGLSRKSVVVVVVADAYSGWFVSRFVIKFL